MAGEPYQLDDGVIGEKAKESQPYIRQMIIGKAEQLNEDEFERILYMIRKRTEKRIREQQLARNETFYVASLSSRTIVYKGMLVPDQLDQYYLDLQDEDLTSTFVLSILDTVQIHSLVGKEHIRTECLCTMGKSTPLMAMSIG